MNILHKMIITTLTLMSVNVYAEIEQITIRWTSLKCSDSCIKILDRELKKMHGVDEIAIDQGAGQATMTWKPNIPFQYTTLNTAMHMVGLSMRDVRIKVKGTISPSGNSIYIVSKGDNTRFELVNPVTPNRTGQAVEYNYAARLLSPAMRQQLTDAYNQRQVVTIEGPVFMPERMTVPTQIVVDHFSAEAPKPK